MTVLVLKLALTPTLIGLASLAGRRWGSAIGGWLVALPLTTGPIALFLALDHGPSFAAAAATGSLAGAAAQAAFCLGFGGLGRVASWSTALLGGALGFAAASLAIQPALGLPIGALLVLVVIVLTAAIRLMPRGSRERGLTARPHSDLPVRMAIGTVIVVGLTAMAPLLGPRLTGLLATFPVITAVLAVFAHRSDGPDHGVAVARGLLIGLFGFAGFFTVLAGSIESVGTALSFGLAIATAFVIQAASLRALLRPLDQ